jgi:hypothetical protein
LVLGAKLILGERELLSLDGLAMLGIEQLGALYANGKLHTNNKKNNQPTGWFIL